MGNPRKPILHHLHDYFFPHSRNNYRPHLFSGISVAVLVIGVLLLEGAYLVQTKFVFLETDFLASVLPGALVALTNEDREMHGLAGVTEDAVLSRAAQAAAEDMAANGYFAHVSPDGKTPWYWLEQVGYRYSYAGENLAVNFTDSVDVESAWMESPTHRANIVKPQYTHVGFGTAHGMYEGQETTFVVEFFATPSTTVEVSAAPVALATDVVTEATTSTTSMQVLGTQSASIAAAAAPAVSHTPSWLARVLASPLNTLLAILSVLLAIIVIAFTIAMLMRAQHPSVIVGGALLVALIGTSMLLSSDLAGPVELVSDAQSAAVGAAFYQ
ncbi:MAG: CAP domain-containing protein [Candidatus Paceibacterota bacterium]|jgi:predicted tellurium resistance membrane protein TerC